MESFGFRRIDKKCRRGIVSIATFLDGSGQEEFRLDTVDSHAWCRFIILAAGESKTLNSSQHQLLYLPAVLLSAHPCANP
jgi:hypothetical protein